jgi:putative transposase
MCRVLEVSPAGFYVWRTRGPSVRAVTDDRLILHVRASHHRSDGTYGAPRVLGDLHDDGWRVGQKRVARLMRQDGLVGRARPRAKGRTTNSQHAYGIAPNVLNRQFAVSEINRV